MYGGGIMSSPPPLLFPPCRRSPLGWISCTGAGISGAVRVLFLQRLTSAQRLSKSNPVRLPQQPRTRCSSACWAPRNCCCQPQHFALELCRSWAQVAHGQMFPGTPRGTSLICVCSRTSEVALPHSPSCFLVASQGLLEFRYKSLPV